MLTPNKKAGCKPSPAITLRFGDKGTNVKKVTHVLFICIEYEGFTVNSHIYAPDVYSISKQE